MKKVIRVVAPGRPIGQTIADRVVARLASLNISNEFHLEFAEQCFLVDGHFAGNDQIRAGSLKAALEDDRVDVIWSARGGYGSCRLMDEVEQAKVTVGKTLVGYSDFSFLSSMFLSHEDIRIIHGPMPIDIIRDGGEYAVDSVLKAIAQSYHNVQFEGGDPDPVGVVVNLSVLTRLIGTKWMPNLRGCVVIVEDVSEHLYSIDRMFFQLSAWPGINEIAAIGLGKFTNVPDNDAPFGETVEEMARRWFASRGVKVISGFQVGHMANNRCFIQRGRDWKLLLD
jgi:muramoyltetrapeptide carboxypeptidase